MNFSLSACLLLFPVLMAGCIKNPQLIIHREVTGPIETNAYLIYDSGTKNAALIDPGDTVDSLLKIIYDQNLHLEYFLITHGHFDHIVGLPDIRNLFPEAKVCIHPLDYENMKHQKKWAYDNFPEMVAEWEKDPTMSKIINFNTEDFPYPDIFLEDNQILELGNLEIEVIHSPGHSPGGVCYFIDNKLFSGDVLFYRSVGRSDVMNSSPEDLIKSVKKLYSIFNDDVPVYPGHGDYTDIGSEKKHNKYITSDEI